MTEVPLDNEVQEKIVETSQTDSTTIEPTITLGNVEEVWSEHTSISAETYISYTVQPGDTLAGICYKQYGNTTRMQEIQTINQIANEDKIYSGQVLLLPE